MGRRISVLACLSILCSTSAAAATVIEGVPSYIWHRGCGPTAGGMIVGYWDAHGFGDLIDGAGDWEVNRAAIQDMIASPGHVRDYVPTPDRTPTAADPYHADDCLADFMGASRGLLAYGDSYDSRQAAGLMKYFAYRGYAGVTSYSRYVWGLWGDFTASIDAGRPVELYVDRSGNGVADHFVAAFGYDETDPAAPKYLCYNTDDHLARWYDFTPVGPGKRWGVYAGTLLDPGPIAGDSDSDGDVDFRDYLNLKQHLGTGGGAAWSEGDFDADGDVDAADLERMAENFGVDITPDMGASGGPTSPEPGTAGLLLLAGTATLFRLRRRRQPTRNPTTRP